MLCLSARRKTADNTTFDTVCHNPAQRLHGLALEDYNNSKCEMKEVVGMGSQFFICSCSEDECNEDIFFTSGAYTGLSRKHLLFLFFSLSYWVAKKKKSECLQSDSINWFISLLVFGLNAKLSGHGRIKGACIHTAPFK